MEARSYDDVDAIATSRAAYVVLCYRLMRTSQIEKLY